MPTKTQTAEPGAQSTEEALAEAGAIMRGMDGDPQPVREADPTDRGMAALLAEDPDATKIWEAKGPKNTNVAFVAKVELNDSFVILEQRASGSFKVYELRQAKVAP